MKMTKKQLIVEHKKLHKALDRLLACWISTKDASDVVKFWRGLTVGDLLNWSHQQTINPECTKFYD